MSLPRFCDRIIDAALPLLDGLNRDDILTHLEKNTIRLDCSNISLDDTGISAGYILAANLLARLYPRIVFSGPEELTTMAGDMAREINPELDFDGSPTFTLSFSTDVPDNAGVAVTASGWNVIVDGAIGGPIAFAAPPAALAAAAVGVGEIFRMVFADFIPHGRKEPQPGSFNLVTLEPWSDVPLPDMFDVGSVHLAGAGAIGEAVAETLRVTPVKGELIVVDPQTIDYLNLQRYLIAKDSDVGERKTALVARSLAGTEIEVIEVPTFWGDDDRSAPGQTIVLAALDTAEDRIGVQAGLHGRVYNAYTQPDDIGWSRHEHFGVEPCLACLYLPTDTKPHRYELIADILNQPSLRVRGYLATNTPAGTPLPPSFQLPMTDSPPSPEELLKWRNVSILVDIANAFGLHKDVLNEWTSKSIDDLYREGICGGAIVRTRNEETARDMLVPLAHQSAFAGIMLAVQMLVASDDKLRKLRPQKIEGRYNILRRVPTTIAIPCSRVSNCICSDEDFKTAWNTRWIEE